MEAFWKVIGITMTALILSLQVEKQGKDFACILVITACCIAAVSAVSCLSPVLDLLQELEEMVSIKQDILRILFKCTAIAIIADLSSHICNDTGNGALGNVLNLMGSAVILYLSIPIVELLLALIRELLGIL